MKNDLKLQAYENKSKSKLVAYILLILLGTLGIHRFYLRRYLT
ncbi:MAG: NINE protein, partial [Thiotrichales bacterium]|nr:NINE protein [Thiotrichales bacterium]